MTTRQENGGVRVVADFRDRDGQIVPGLAVSAKFVHPIDPVLGSRCAARQ